MGKIKQMKDAAGVSFYPVTVADAVIVGENIKLTTVLATLATQSKLGMMSAADKTKLDGIKEGATKYTFEGGTNKFTVTPDGGTPQEVTITPSITNNITGSGTSGQLAVFNGTKTLTGRTITSVITDAAGSADQIPTNSAVKTYVDGLIGGVTGALLYKGTIGTAAHVTAGSVDVSALPAKHEVGWTYIVADAGTYAGQVCEVGDMIICKTAGTTASNADWNVINGENQVENKAATLSWGQSVTIATVDGTNITVTLPANPNTDVACTYDGHYTPSGTAVTMSTTVATSVPSVVSGISKDGKGHVTDVTTVKLGAASIKGVTDNSTATAVSSTDTNLITARTLYYAGYVKSSGVTKVQEATDGAVSVSGGTTATVTLNLKTVTNTDSTGTAQTMGTTAGSDNSKEITVVTGVTKDSYGRVSGVETTKVTLKNTTYSAATKSAAGLMSAADKTALDSLSEDAISADEVAGLTAEYDDAKILAALVA